MYKTQTTNERSENKKTRKQRSESFLRNSSFSLSLPLSVCYWQTHPIRRVRFWLSVYIVLYGSILSPLELFVVRKILHRHASALALCVRALLLSVLLSHCHADGDCQLASVPFAMHKNMAFMCMKHICRSRRTVIDHPILLSPKTSMGESIFISEKNTVTTQRKSLESVQFRRVIHSVRFVCLFLRCRASQHHSTRDRKTNTQYFLWTPLTTIWRVEKRNETRVFVSCSCVRWLIRCN